MNKGKILAIVQVLANLVIFILLVSSNFVSAYDFPAPTYNIPTGSVIPGSQPILMYDIAEYLIRIADLFIIIGPILLIVSLVLSAITYMAAGANPALAGKAKKWFGYSLIGGLVVFGVGVIINTVAAIVTRDFFCRVTFMGVCIFN